MTAEEVLRFQEAVPFHPYEIFLADGRVLAIGHPDFLSVSARDQLMRIYELPDGLETVDLMLVVSLRFPVKIAAKKP